MIAKETVERLVTAGEHAPVRYGVERQSHVVDEARRSEPGRRKYRNFFRVIGDGKKRARVSDGEVISVKARLKELHAGV